MFWYVVIMFLFLYPIVLSGISHSAHINIDRFASFCMVSVLGFFMSMRSINVGADTKQYVTAFQQISRIDLRNLFSSQLYAWGGYSVSFERGYLLYNKIISFFVDNGQAITIINSLLIVLLLAAFVRKWSPIPVLSYWLYLTLGFFQTQMNMSRNAIGIFLSYIAFQFIDKKRPVLFSIIILIASLFHRSALMLLPVYWLVNYIGLNHKRVIRLLIAFVVFGLVYSSIGSVLMRVVPYIFQRYFLEGSPRNDGLFVGVFQLSLVSFVYIMIHPRNKDILLNDTSLGCWMFLIEILFFALGVNLFYGNRMAAVFSPYIIVFLPSMISKGIQTQRKRTILTAILMLISGIQYIIRLSINNIGLTQPYEFFWNIR